LRVFKKTFQTKKLLRGANLIFRLQKTFSIFLGINLIFMFGCSALKKNNEINICSYANLPCLESTEYVLLITNKGKIKLELYGKLAPVTVGSFIDFVEKGSYNNTTFNRVIRKPYPFIIRGGDNSLLKGKNKFIDEKTGKIRYIPLEIKLKNNKLPIYGKEIDVSNQKMNIELRHERASLSMARSKQLNSASSQFYISLKSLPELDGRFAVFGKVVSGMDVVDLIQEEDFIIKALKL
tara:strand:- start:1635 stop:2345 length:711 start_codon:yes stop_codon:yes gene_type:complete